MSFSILKLIPTNPRFIPEPSRQEAAITHLKSVFGSTPQVVLTNEVEFIDQGENFESVWCNICDKGIPVELWQELMDKAYESNFSTLEIISPCCGENTSLNSLHYITPAGFSKFSIVIENSDVNVSQAQLSVLSDILGVELKVIVAKY